MKKKWVSLLLIAALVLCAICWSGIGYHSSSAATQDLIEELTALHGEPYTNRQVENGAEDMELSVEPMTFFLTNWNLRQALGLDYRYKCSVTYTVHSAGEVIDVHVITYTGFDPMGNGNEAARAYIDTDSKTES